MLTIRLRQFTLVVSAIFTWQLFVIGQTATPTPKPKPTPDDEIIKVESRLVVVPVSVTDANGQPVLGLKAQDFRIDEENKQQTIENLGDAEIDIAFINKNQ